MKKIVFVGLGNMGLPMAGNLAARFDGVVCGDIAADARARAAAAGLRTGEDLPALAADADAVISMLPAGEHVGALLLGDGGLFAAAPASALFIDCSTTSPQEARAFAAAAPGAFLDAPVSGGIGGAKAATLSFLVGGDAAALARARPLLEAMGANVFHAGGGGDGQAAKLCNNMMLSVQMAGVCEALSLGMKMGLDAATLSEIMRKSSGGNWVTEKYNPVPGVMPNAPAANGYRGGFMTDLMVKDSDLAMRAARDANATTPLGALANQLFRLHRQNGSGALDFSSILKMFQ